MPFGRPVFGTSYLSVVACVETPGARICRISEHSPSIFSSQERPLFRRRPLRLARLLGRQPRRGPAGLRPPHSFAGRTRRGRHFVGIRLIPVRAGAYSLRRPQFHLPTSFGGAARLTSRSHPLSCPSARRRPPVGLRAMGRRGIACSTRKGNGHDSATVGGGAGPVHPGPVGLLVLPKLLLVLLLRAVLHALLFPVLHAVLLPLLRPVLLRLQLPAARRAGGSARAGASPRVGP